MPSIEWVVADDGEIITHQVKGVKGAKCKPIHNQIATDLHALGAETIESRDTPEMNETPERQVQRTAQQQGR